MKNIIVFDDFYTDPLNVRELVIKAGFDEIDPANRPNYCGVNSVAKVLPDSMVQYISMIVGEQLKSIDTSCSGFFRAQKIGDTAKQHIHVDFPTFNCKWAGVVYMSPPELFTTEAACYFWRHKRLGIDTFPMSTQGAADLGFHSPADLKHFMDTEGMDETLWDKVGMIGQKFNRLVLFRSNIFHSPGELFGNSIENGRLIQTFFFE